MVRLGISLAVVLAVLFCIAAPKPALALACRKASDHNAAFGQRKSGDEMLYSTHVAVTKKLFRVVTYDLNYPSNDDKHGVITAIEINDLKKDGTGGCISILDGGVGSDHAGIHFKSQRNKAVDFDVKIYGFANSHW